MRSVELFLGVALCALAAPAIAQMTPTQRTTSDGRPLASSLPARGPAKRAGPTTLRFEELARHRGELLEITTIYGVRRQGRVDSAGGSTLRLRVSAGLGYAIVNIERAQIRLIRDLD